MTSQRRYTERFNKNLVRYQNLRERVRQRIEQISENPLKNTERLGHAAGGLNLKGCRSARVGRNFRIIFVICAECRKEPECEYCICEGLPDESIVFLNFGPHEKAYAMK